MVAGVRLVGIISLVIWLSACKDQAGSSVPDPATSGTSPVAANADLTVADCRDNNDYSCISVVHSGQGNCVVVSCSNGEQMVVDCGGDAVATAVTPFFTDLNLPGPALKAIVVSHPHADHYNLLPSVLPSIPADGADRYFYDVVESADASTEYKTDFFAWYKSNVQDSTTARLTHRPLDPGTSDPEGRSHLELSCRGVTGSNGVYIMAANVGLTVPLEEYREDDDPESPCYDQDDDSPRNSRVNDRSIVLKFQRDNLNVILPGDAGKRVERWILGNYPNPGFLKTTALLLSHHGSCYGVNTVPWVEAVQPEIVIASAGENLGYSHPRCLTTDLYQSKSPVATAASHDYGCYKSRRNFLPVPNKTKAVYNTNLTSLTVLRYHERNQSYDLWTCPDNQISATCKQGVP